MSKVTQSSSIVQGGKPGWACFWIYSFFLVYGSLMPPAAIPSFVKQINDKVLHAVEYYFLFIVAWNAFRKSQKDMIRRYPYRFAFFWGFALGGATELGQFFVPGRHTDLLDLTADLAGLGAGLGFVYLLNHFFKRTNT